MTEFKPGDRVFAKVKGYPYWPGRIEEPDPKYPVTKTRPYLVFFFGTHEVSLCGVKDVISYEENRVKLGVPKKMRGYNEGIWEIANCPTVSREEPIGGAERIPQVEEVDGLLIPVKSELNESVEVAQEATETPKTEKKEAKPKRGKRAEEVAVKVEVPEAEELPIAEATPSQTTRSGRVSKKVKGADEEEKHKTSKATPKRGNLRTQAAGATPARQSARMRIVKDDIPAVEQPVAVVPVETEKQVATEETKADGGSTVSVQLEDGNVGPSEEAKSVGPVESSEAEVESVETPLEPSDLEALKARQADLYDDETGSADEIEREYSSPPPLAERHLVRRNGGSARKPAEAKTPEKPKRRWEKQRNLSVSEKPIIPAAVEAAEGKNDIPTPSESKKGRGGRQVKRHVDVEQPEISSPPQSHKKRAESPIPEDPEMTSNVGIGTKDDQQEAIDHIKSLVRVELDIKQSLLIGHFDFKRCIQVLETFKARMDNGEVTKNSLVRIPSLVDTLRKCRKFTACRDIRQVAISIMSSLSEMFADLDGTAEAQLESPASGDELWFKNFKRESEKFLRENREWAQLLRDRFALSGMSRKRNASSPTKNCSPPPAKRLRVEAAEEGDSPPVVPSIPVQPAPIGEKEVQPEVSLPVEAAEPMDEGEAGELSVDTANDNEPTGPATEEEVVLPDVKDVEERAAQQSDNSTAQQPLMVSPGSALASGPSSSRPASVSPALPLQPISMGTMRKDICDIDIE